MNRLAWHVCGEDMKLGYGDGRKIVPGETLWVTDETREIKCCKYGMHGSYNIMDAIYYAQGPMICRVRLLDIRDEQTDKASARGRRCLWHVDGTRLLRLFACDCAEQSLSVTKNPDPRSIESIRVARLYANGKASTEQLAAARAAAWDAARDAERDAAWAAARDAERAAAWAAARYAARYAARQEQSKLLLSMVKQAQEAERRCGRWLQRKRCLKNGGTTSGQECHHTPMRTMKSTLTAWRLRHLLSHILLVSDSSLTHHNQTRRRQSNEES